MKRCLLSLALVLGLLIAAAAPAFAQGQEVVVERRDGTLEIQPNGDVRVAETWQVQFIGGPFRFAFRAIPLNRVSEITDWGVSENGQVYSENSSEDANTFELADENGERKIAWHFSPSMDETRTFVVAYTLRGALRIDSNGDQFFWKFVEADRGYPIEASRVVLTLPQEFDAGALLATTYQDRAEQRGARIVDGRTIEFTGGPFPPGEEWEIRAQFPHGAVSASPPAWQRIQERQPVYNLVALVAALLVLIGGSLGLYMLWFSRGRDRATGMVAEFLAQPPDSLPPGVAGTLLDERADMKDILATLVDLARRGFIQIVDTQDADDPEIEAGFRFVRLRGDDGSLRPYERRLFDRIFGQRTERDLHDLRQKFYKDLPELQQSLYDAAVEAGYFVVSPQQVRTRYAVAGVGLAVLAGLLGFFGYAFIATYAPLAILVVFAAVFVGIALAVLGRFMPRKTPQGATAAAKWRAFRRYLANVERYTEVEQAQEQFDRYLPYAIAFGIEKQWVKKFEAVNTPAPGWYQPYPHYYPTHTYSTGRGLLQDTGDRSGGSSQGSGGMPSLDSMAGRTFGGLNAMSAGLFTMLDSTASTFTSQPPSSTGGGGGGWSGGGGGGGGGSSGFG